MWMITSSSLSSERATYLNIIENSFNASSETPDWFLAWICCSKLCCILIPSWSNWSQACARPTVLCSVYRLSRIKCSSSVAPKSSIFFKSLRRARTSAALRCKEWELENRNWLKLVRFYLSCFELLFQSPRTFHHRRPVEKNTTLVLVAVRGRGYQLN